MEFIPTFPAPCFTVSGMSVRQGIKFNSEGILEIGQEGRGRKIVRLSKTSFSPSRIEKDNMDYFECKEQRTGVLLLVKDVSGFRGSWEMKEAKGVKVIAEGFCAQGIAGRMGGGPEYLLFMEDGGSFVMSRSGRLYGYPQLIKVNCEEKKVSTLDLNDNKETLNAEKALGEL